MASFIFIFEIFERIFRVWYETSFGLQL